MKSNCRPPLLFAGLMLIVFLTVNPFPQVGQAHASSPSVNEPQKGLPSVEARIADNVYQLEVAKTPQQAEDGLMFRTELPERHGMLFLFHPSRPVVFWMKNTLIPLDILFIDRKRVIAISPDALPCRSNPCSLYPSHGIVDQVIELPAGAAKKEGIIPGSRVHLMHSVRLI